MAESAPLTAAYAHARKAADETLHIRWQQAADEHRDAAAEYSRAARATADSEALRVLRLLEEQHHRLVSIIRDHDMLERALDTDGKPESLSGIVDETPDLTAQSNVPKAHVSSKAPASSSSLPTPRMGGREGNPSPSLARDIASRRGIPLPERVSQPSAAAQARARQLSPEARHRPLPGPAARIPPSITDSQSRPTRARAIPSTENDDGFAKFYSSITSGTMSKLSSVLAYAGLPLNAEDTATAPQPQSSRKSGRKSVTAESTPDVKRLFSEAALSALEDEHRQRGTLGHGFGPAESFYVVPQSGGTKAYADIVKLQQHQLSTLGEDDEFVDASETQGPPSPKQRRRPASVSVRGPFGAKSQSSEELELENATLKTTLEQLASRLANFEAHAQDASMALLTQSMIGARPSSSGGHGHAGPALGGGGAVNDTALQERIRHLEQHVEQQAQEEHRLRELASKQEKALKKWDKRFEVLNTRAREKRNAKQQSLEKGVDRAGGETVAPASESGDQPPTLE